MCWGGEEQPQEDQGQAYSPMIYPPTEFMPSGNYGAGDLLGGTTQVNSPGLVPTAGWAGSGNYNYIPGAAQQMLAGRRFSPQYLFR